MPFYGHVYVAYLPRERVTGLSKLDQLVEKYSLRLQIQERMTRQIADEIEEKLEPKGVMVVIKATHTCKLIEGYSTGEYITSAVRGLMLTHDAPRHEALSLFGLLKNSDGST